MFNKRRLEDSDNDEDFIEEASEVEEEEEEDDGIDVSNIIESTRRSSRSSSREGSPAKRARLSEEMEEEEEEEGARAAPEDPEPSDDDNDEEEDAVFSNEDQEAKVAALDAEADNTAMRQWTKEFMAERDRLAMAKIAELAAVVGVEPPVFVEFVSTLGPYQPGAVYFRDSGGYPSHIKLNSQAVTNERSLDVVCAHMVAHWADFAARAPQLVRGWDAGTGLDAAEVNERHAHESRHYASAVEKLRVAGHSVDFDLNVVTVGFKSIVACECGAYFLATTTRTDLEGANGLKHSGCPLKGRFRIVRKWTKGDAEGDFDLEHPPNVHGFLPCEAATIVARAYEEREDMWAPYPVEEPRHTSERYAYWRQPTTRFMRCFHVVKPPAYKDAPNTYASTERGRLAVDE